MRPGYALRPLPTFVLACALAVASIRCAADEAARKPPSAEKEEGVYEAPEGADGPQPAPGFLERYARTHGFDLGTPRRVRIGPKGEAVFFLRSGPQDFVQDLWMQRLGEERAERLASASELAASGRASGAQRARRERRRQAGRGITTYRLGPEGERVLVPVRKQLFVVPVDGDEPRELPEEGGAPVDPRWSPDGERVAVVRDGDLYVVELETGVQRRLTEAKREHVTHGVAEFVAQEEMDRMRGYWWGPEGERLLYQRTHAGGVETRWLHDPARPGKEPRRRAYPAAGTANVRVWLGVISAEGGETTWLQWDRTRYPYLARVRWRRNVPLTLLVQNRAQTEEKLLVADPDEGGTRTLHVERDEAWLELDPQMPRWLPGGDRFLWTTQRRGAWQLELRDRSGALVRVITPPWMGYRRLVDVRPGSDGSEGSSGGFVRVVAGKDPTRAHLWRVPLGDVGDAPTRLTERAGMHGGRGAGRGAGELGLWLHDFRGLDGKRWWRIRDAEGERVAELRSVADEPNVEPNVELTSAEADGRLYHAALVRPRRMPRRGSLPVILHVYGGPGVQMVTADRRRYLLDQWLADHGAVVVRIDGRGTPYRGREWERALDGAPARVPLSDQRAALRALIDEHARLDGERVGVYGWSYGGYLAAMAAMRQPDLVDVAVAGAPVADWHDYDTHYTERYLGLPSDRPGAYDRSSLLNAAPTLRRPLLVLHGTRDGNVWLQHSLKLVDALFRAGRPVDFLPLSGRSHSVSDPEATRRLYERIASYLLRHLERPPRSSGE